MARFLAACERYDHNPNEFGEQRVRKLESVLILQYVVCECICIKHA